jgi:cAMP-specific phosphodiesterase 4
MASTGADRKTLNTPYPSVSLKTAVSADDVRKLTSSGRRSSFRGGSALRLSPQLYPRRGHSNASTRRRSLSASQGNLGAIPNTDDYDDDSESAVSARSILIARIRRIRQRVVHAVETANTQVLLMFALFLALFLTDSIIWLSAPDAVDYYVNITLVVALFVLSAEFLLNLSCKDKYPFSFYFWMDLLGTFSIIADVPWLSDGWLPDGAELGTALRVSKAAKDPVPSSRVIVLGHGSVSTVTRIARLLRVLRVFRFYEYICERWNARNQTRNHEGTDDVGDGGERKKKNDAGKKKKFAAGKGTTSRMGKHLQESMSKNVAIIVILTILAAAMVTWEDKQTIPRAYHKSLQSVSSIPGGSAALGGAVGDTISSNFYQYFSVTERKPMALVLGARSWDWTSTHPRSQRSGDTITVVSGDCSPLGAADPGSLPLGNYSGDSGGGGGRSGVAYPPSCVMLELDIAAINRWSAGLRMSLVAFVITQLVLVSALLVAVTNRIVVFPIERIFNNIKKSMDTIMGAFGGKVAGDDDDDEDGGMGTIEAAIEKMTRLVKHVAGSGAQGDHMLNEYINDANMDDNTRAWLMSMHGHEQDVRTFTPVPTPGATDGVAVIAKALSPTESSRRGGSGIWPTPRSVISSNHKNASQEDEVAANAHVDDSLLEAHSDDDEFDVDGLLLRTGPKLQLQQARRRSRTRSYAANTATAAAADNDIHLPTTIDNSIINTWNFDALALTSEEMRSYVLLMFGSLGLLRSDVGASGRTPNASLDADAAALGGFCSTTQLWHFIMRIEGSYRGNAYHNFQHAVDVTHTVYRYIVLTEPRTHISPVEKFALMVAALSHDLDHPGLNNAFLINTKDQLATLYNDSSVLENNHIACLYNLINTRQTQGASLSTRKVEGTRLPPPAPHQEDEANIFAALDDVLYREVRRIIIAAVLHTDMSHHFKMVSQMEVFYELHSEGIKANTRRVNRGIMVDCIYDKSDDRQFVLNVILHAADISNPVKPLKTYNKWANRQGGTGACSHTNCFARDVFICILSFLFCECGCLLHAAHTCIRYSHNALLTGLNLLVAAFHLSSDCY